MVAETGPKFDPMHQFEIVAWIPLKIGGLDLSYTNSSFWMSVAVLSSFIVLGGFGARRSSIPGRFQLVGELLYEFTANTLRDYAGKEGMRYFPLIFTLFMLVLFGNLAGMIPYSFTYTSHIVVTMTLALSVFVAVTILGFARHGFGYLKLFVPEGVPIFLLPLIILIEVISYLSRPVSLSVRLFANMMAGHTMLKVFAGFSVLLGSFYGLGPLAINIALTGFEFLVAVLQAYVFTVLSCLYLNDALHLH